MEICARLVISAPILRTCGMLNNTLPKSNILIKDNHRACVTDTGLDALSELHIHPGRVAAPSKWLFKSPEELERGLRGMPQDVYAFGSTAYIVSHGLSTFRQTDSMTR